MLSDSIAFHKLKRTHIDEFKLEPKVADGLLLQCKKIITEYEMGGRRIIQFGHDYLYSGLNHIGRKKPEFIDDLIESLNSRLQTSFNSVLLNVYPANKKVGIGKHSDSEEGLEYDPLVASISLGSSDFFNIVSNDPYDDDDSLMLPVDHGTVLLMGRGCQIYYQHYIKPSVRQQDRISLTFRKMVGSHDEDF